MYYESTIEKQHKKTSENPNLIFSNLIFFKFDFFFSDFYFWFQFL